MTRGEWVLLPGPLGMLGLLGFAFAMNSGSLFGPSSANEIDASRVCAYLCDASLAGKPCEVFCTSRRQSSNQSNTVANEKDVVVVGANEVRDGTRLRACPTLCRHGLGIPRCACEPRVSGVAVSWEEVCASFCEDEDHQPTGCLHCSKNDQRIDGRRDDSFAGSGTPSKDIDGVISTPRGTERANHVTGEPDDDDDDGNLRKLNAERTTEDFDLEKFCEAECKRGNGGLACRCDIIP